jgi:5-dehydro-2-deoxygluconokinase
MPLEPGYTKELILLQFDHRGPFLEEFCGIKGRAPNQMEARLAASYKDIVYDGWKKAMLLAGAKDKTAVLVDAFLGQRCLEEAQGRDFMRALPVERPGMAEFDFDQGAKYPRQLDQFAPTFVKAQVRFNVESDKGLLQRQADRLKSLTEFLRQSSRRLLLELVVSPTGAQLEACGGNRARFEQERRPSLAAAAIATLQNARVEPDVWKLEPAEKPDDLKTLCAAARAGTRAKIGVVLTARGNSVEEIKSWMPTGDRIPGIIGFAIGKPVYGEALLLFRDRKHPREAAVEMVAKRFKEWLDAWNAVRMLSRPPGAGTGVVGKASRSPAVGPASGVRPITGVHPPAGKPASARPAPAAAAPAVSAVAQSPASPNAAPPPSQGSVPARAAGAPAGTSPLPLTEPRPPEGPEKPKTVAAAGTGIQPSSPSEGADPPSPAGPGTP